MSYIIREDISKTDSDINFDICSSSERRESEGGHRTIGGCRPGLCPGRFLTKPHPATPITRLQFNYCNNYCNNYYHYYVYKSAWHFCI